MRLLVPIATGLATILLSAAPREIVITGSVTDAVSGRPVAGAQVSISESRASTSTASNGRYSVRVRLADSQRVVLGVRTIGYNAFSRVLTTPHTGDTLVADVTLTPVALHLDALVTTAGVQPMSGMKAPFAVAALSGRVPGAGGRGGRAYGNERRPATADTAFNTEEYDVLEENPFRAVSSNPLSTLSADVDRAAYSNVRRFIRMGQLPPKGAVRIEEMLNYFTYEYTSPESAPIAIHTDAAPAPWKPSHRIVRIGLQAQRVSTEKLPPANLVFLIDVSGSMMAENKLPLVKLAYRLLLDQLREQDRVAIVVYAGAAGLVLPSTPASNKQAIIDAIDRLEAGGSTAGGAGIELAYKVAKENFRKDGNNRVILATDGDFNVGVSSTGSLVDLIEAKRGEGIFLTALGFGMGNIKDHRLEQLADKGNGNYAYIDNLMEAKKVFVAEFGGTLFTVAKDVKIQVEFNPATVQAYRLIGYENRLLAKEDFENDAKDAGDVGSGHTVTALYEIVPVGSPLDVELGSVRPFRYQTVTPERANVRPDELMTVSVRYKEPTGDQSRLIQSYVSARQPAAAADLRFASAVAAYGMLLHRSKHVGTFDYDAVLRLASDALGPDREGYRAEFVELVRSTKAIAAQVASREK